MENLFLRCGLVIALFGFLLAWENPSATAQEEPFLQPVPNSTRMGVLVLKTGQIVEGRLSQNAGGYLVNLAKGSYLVPYARVSVVAENRHQAYEKLTEKQPNPTPAYRVAMARWCIAWKLYAEARIELRDALIADPEHKEALQMYSRLSHMINPEQQPLETLVPKSKTPDGFTPSEPESLEGLSPDLARQYVVRVQPIFLNRCGNAGCHSPSSEQKFQLTHIRRGLNQQTLKNLNAVLQYVDIDSPMKSELLTKASETHGGKARPIFYGTTGQKNLEAIKEWVAQVAKEKNGDSIPKSKPKGNVLADLVHRDSQSEEPQDKTLFLGQPEDQAPLSPKERENQEKEAILQDILRNESEDAFDPREFNRKFGS